MIFLRTLTLARYLSCCILEGQPVPWTFLRSSCHWAWKQDRAAVRRATWRLWRLSPLLKALPLVSQLKVQSDHIDKQHKVEMGIRKIKKKMKEKMGIIL